MTKIKISQKWPILIGLIFASFAVICGLVSDQMIHWSPNSFFNILPIILFFVFINAYILIWSIVNVIFTIHSKINKMYYVSSGISLISNGIFVIYFLIGVYLYLPIYHAGKFRSFVASETLIGNNWTHLALQGFDPKNKKFSDICHIVYSKNMHDSYISFALKLTRFQGKIVVIIRRDNQFDNEYIYLPFEEAIYEYRDGTLTRHKGSLKDFE